MNDKRYDLFMSSSIKVLELFLELLDLSCLGFRDVGLSKSLRIILDVKELDIYLVLG